MEPRIQYCTTSDGISIAYWSVGTGPPVIVLPQVAFTHVQLELQIPEYRAWYEAMASRCNLIRYDHRGAGLSDKNAGDFTIEERILDVKAVMDALGVSTATMMAPIVMGPMGIQMAAKHHDRVSRLILWCSFSEGEEYFRQPVVQGLFGILDKDWDLYCQTVSHTALGWTEGESARRYSNYMKECVSWEAALAMFRKAQTDSVTELLPDVRCPTLVVHRRQVSFPDVELSRKLAAKIPNARLALLEGNSLAPFLGDMDSVVSLELEFINEGAAQQPESAAAYESAFRTVLFTDLVGHTEMMSRLGDERGREVLREHERITREVLAANGGTEVKTMGDGFMASFGSVTKAVECAIALQNAFATWNTDVGAQGLAPLHVRVGLNAGEPIEEEGPDGQRDLFGATVILASRIAAKAEVGEILVADTVRGLCSGKGFLFSDRGEFAAKGFEEPVRVYEVRWKDE